jgi:hypothetical protein
MAMLCAANFILPTLRAAATLLSLLAAQAPEAEPSSNPSKHKRPSAAQRKNANMQGAAAHEVRPASLTRMNLRVHVVRSICSYQYCKQHEQRERCGWLRMHSIDGCCFN